MSRGKDAIKVGAIVGACSVCCPPLLLMPLGLLGGLGAGATATSAVFGAPAWLVALLVLLTVTAAIACARGRLRARPTDTPVTAQGRLTLPLTHVTASGPEPTAPTTGR